MTAVPFVFDFDHTYGDAVEVAPTLTRVLANNPSKFTFHGTGTYLVGTNELTVVDPGPRDDAHLAAIVHAIADRPVTHILITHTHGDHSPLAESLKQLTGARTYGYGPHPPDARSEETDAGEEIEDHNDYDFVPDVKLNDGDIIETAEATFEALHTPGHISNHLCFSWREANALFTGDHVMGWSTTVIPPPNGDMFAYLTNLERLLHRREQTYWPTHGPPVTDPIPFVNALIEHRRGRERQIVSLLDEKPRTVDQLVAIMYADVDQVLHKPAAGSVRAHLLALIAAEQVDETSGVFTLR